MRKVSVEDAREYWAAARAARVEVEVHQQTCTSVAVIRFDDPQGQPQTVRVVTDGTDDQAKVVATLFATFPVSLDNLQNKNEQLCQEVDALRQRLELALYTVSLQGGASTTVAQIREQLDELVVGKV